MSAPVSRILCEPAIGPRATISFRMVCDSMVNSCKLRKNSSEAGLVAHSSKFFRNCVSRNLSANGTLIRVRDVAVAFPLQTGNVNRPRSKNNVKRLRLNPNGVAEAKGGFEADAPEADGVQIALVGKSESAQRLKLLFGKILSIVFKDKLVVYHTHAGRFRAGVIRILQQL